MARTRKAARMIGGGLSFALLACSVAVHAAGPHDGPNIVLFYTDDMHWDDLPFFAPPIKWVNSDEPTDPTAPHSSLKSHRLLRPDLNRLSARLFANPSTGALRNMEPSPSPSPFGGCDSATYDQTPVDLDVNATGDVNCQTFTYTSSALCASQDAAKHVKKGWEDPIDPNNPANPRCNPTTDILPGFGGLASLREDGVMFTRAYANSARCGPARASLFSGRYITRMGFVDNGSELGPDEVTFAEFLKQGCRQLDDGPRCVDANGDFEACPCHLPNGCVQTAGPDIGDSIGACYTTGLIGKWHLGGGTGKDPWEQGFDEHIGFGGGSRHYYRRAPLRCSPEARSFCSDGSSVNEHGLCTVDTDCGTGACESPTVVPRGLYVGPVPDFNNCTGTQEYCKNDWTQGCSVDTDCGIGPDAKCIVSVAARSPYCCEPTAPGRKGIYRYPHHRGAVNKQHRKPNPSNPEDLGGEVLFWLKDGAQAPLGHSSGLTGRIWPCSDATEETVQSGCLYSTRRVRDQTRDFIKRHGSEANPFFVMISMHAPHFALVAPKRTAQHYLDLKGHRPNRPLGGAANYWAILEEIDHTVGEVLKELDSLGRQTVVFFTDDHGGPHSGYGVPQLNAGKENVTEGGIRTGLFVATTGPGSYLNLTRGYQNDDALSGQIDLYPTLADLAGWKSKLTVDGQLDLCSEPDNPSCPTKRRLDGRNLTPMLLNDPNDPGSAGRDFVFASFHGTGKAIVGRAGMQTSDGVCAWDGVTNPNKVGYEATVRAASCVACSGSCPQNTDCHVLGKLCLLKDQLNGCGNKTAPCECAPGNACTNPGDHPRCRGSKDCESGEKCAFAKVDCDECVTSGSWKMRGDVSGSAVTVKEVFELNTNPEENPGPTGSELDCQEEFTGVKDDLEARLAYWSQCTASRDKCVNVDCATMPSGTACYDLP